MRVLIDSRRPGSPGTQVSAAELEALYRFPDRPWLRSNFVTSLDGAIVGGDGRSGSINTPPDNRVFALQRDLCDAVLVGSGTVRAEGYERLTPTRRRPVPPALVVVSGSGRVPEGLRRPTEGRGSGLLVTCESAGSRRLDRARSVLGADAVLVAGSEHVDLAAAVRTLAARGLRHLLCEDGPTLLTAELAAGIVDEMALSSAPVVVGGAGSRITAGAPLGEPNGIRLAPRLLLEDAGTLLGLWRVRPVTSP